MNKLEDNLTQKDKYRQRTNDIILLMVVGLAISAVGLTIFGKLSPEFNLALGALLGYAGNHTYQNMRTSPKVETTQRNKNNSPYEDDIKE